MPNPSPRTPFEHIRTLSHGAYNIPEQFGRLQDLAFNLWWSWEPEARLLFATIDAETWSASRNPLEVLRHAEEKNWTPLKSSEAFQAKFHQVVGAFDRYMSDLSSTWFHRTHPELVDRPIAYISTEYGLHESLPIYSGGLGVLSGDHTKSASDLGLPMVAVGLLYRRGYFKQTVDADGRQQHRYPVLDLDVLPVRPVLAASGQPLVVAAPLFGRDVKLSVYCAQVGRVPLLLLDSDMPENDPNDRPITNILYVRGREMRLCQEMLLGIGAVRALRALGIDPAVWHLNEGHSALMILERMRESLAENRSHDEAAEHVGRNIVFTTHTPVPAGNEKFDPGLARELLEPWSDTLGTPVDDLLARGRFGEDDSFNLTALALRHATFCNGVSVRHAEVSREMWKPLFPDRETPIVPITNGVHAASWLGLELRDLLERHFGDSWEEACGSSDEWARFTESVPDEELWETHLAHKRRLIREARFSLRQMYARHGAPPRQLATVDHLLDPEVLTIGFARRFATYKRAGMFFHDPDKAKKLLRDEQRPVQILFAGKAHPADHAGQELIASLFALAQSDDVRGRVVFLEDYDMHLGRLLVQGADVWLNNPRRPLEASGTSGQKAAANGCLNLSILDGWWIEGYSPDAGWAIGDDAGVVSNGEGEIDEHVGADSVSLYERLENEVVPLYYDRDESGLPREWIRRMKVSIRDLLPRFCGRRMVIEYCSQAYAPIVSRERVRSE